ncbi:tetratricopeptide repeat protein [Geothrix oryzisoli]|uniref:tetratricopeptide repeat protein n=1 Tax=Geothrix oryzisoli TaxID=2922721 RepID=UPI001FAC992E|nr:tetratricopeptide repeat protein [Geothrix oryzisoli]
MAQEVLEARLESWKEIAAYLDRDVRTVQRWEKLEGLPVHRHLHDKQGSVFALRSEVDVWLDGRRLPPANGNGPEVEVGLPGPGLALEEPAGLEAVPEERAAAEPSVPVPPALRGRSSAGPLALWSLLAVLLAGGTWMVAHRVVRSRPGPALAVLPFVNLGEEKNQEFFSDGFTEELITQLGQQQGEGARVVALRSALGYRNTPKRPRQIARELGVDYLLQGSVRRAGDRVRVTAHLVRGDDETYVWDHSYDRDVRDVLVLQREVADAIAGGINLRLDPGRTHPRAVKPEAYAAYLKGRFFWNRRTPQDLYRALEQFQVAVRLDPTFAPTHVGIADCYALLGSAEMGAMAPKEAMPLAKQAVMAALTLDPSLAEAHASLGHIRLIYDWDWEGAEASFRRAIELNPGYATAHQWYALYLNARGRSEDALEELGKAEQLDPLSPAVKSALAEAHYFARRYGEAAAASQKALELDPHFILGYLNLGRALEMQGRYDEAITALHQGWELSGRAPGMTLFLGHAYAAKGDRRRAEEMLDLLRHPPDFGGRPLYVPALFLAGIQGGLGDREGELQSLRRALDERCEYLIYLEREPMADPIRKDPRFKALLKAVRS